MDLKPNKMAALRAMVKGLYDQQEVRVRTGNRLCAYFKTKGGFSPGETEPEPEDDEEEGDDEDTPEARAFAAKKKREAETAKMLKTIAADYKLIAQGIAKKIKDDETSNDAGKKVRPGNFEPQGVIDDYAAFSLCDQYFTLLAAETRALVRIGCELESHPIYTEFLQKIKGVGPTMGGVLLSYLVCDPDVAQYPSSWWSFCGLDVAPDGRGRGRYKEHMVPREYTSKDGTKEERLSLTFCPFLKTKVVGVLGALFVRMRTPGYREIYDAKKLELAVHPKWGEHNDYLLGDDGKPKRGSTGKPIRKLDENNRIVTSKGRRNRQAIRFMMKRFLLDFFVAWRKIEGLPVPQTYDERCLEHTGGEHRGLPAGQRTIHPELEVGST